MADGNRLVRLIHPAHKDLTRLLPKNRDRKDMRRHIRKLWYWPEMHPTAAGGEVLDLDWCWVRACQGQRIGELRVNDHLAGFNNWRVIFFEGPKPQGKEMHKLWVLQVLQKKRNDFTDNQIDTFETRRLLVVRRYYNGRVD